MARNQEKAQSMLFRFRETQALEMGIGRSKNDRRPRLASMCSSLKEAERWRGEILREISRKVSKIQDAGLSDYAIRDLNDEINKLMREKGHWERQIVALGGANYRRAKQGMVDEDGREVPGTRGYKYFGRAKDLPGVKELFARGADVHESEESARAASFQKFRHRGADYYGDIDEMDTELVTEEEAMEIKDWESATKALAERLALTPNDPLPPFPKTKPTPPAESAAPPAATTTAKSKGKTTKRKAADKAAADDSAAGAEAEKRAKTTEEGTDAITGEGAADASTIAAAEAARISAFFGVLDAKALEAPKQPTREEMEKLLLDLRKRKVLEEMGV